MTRYTLYPQARELLASADLIDRLDAAITEGRYSRFFGMVAPKEWCAELRQAGYWDPKRAPAELATIVEKAKDRVPLSNKSWSVERLHGVTQHAAEADDYPVLFGNHAASVLSVEEFWSAEKHGFPSHEAFWAAVGAYLVGDGSRWWRNAPWMTTTGGQQFVSLLDVNMHHDFTISQRDVTPYATISPLGMEVPCRPVWSVDDHSCNLSRASEHTLLTFLLKYVRQTGIPSVLANVDSAKAYAERMLEQFPRKAGVDRFDESVWLRFSEPLGQIVDGVVFEPTVYDLRARGFVSIDEHNNFVIHGSRKQGEDAKPIAVFPPGEVDTAVDSLFALCGQGRGASFPPDLARTIDAFFSSDSASK